MYRVKAFLIHFSISVVIFLTLAYVLLYVWFPDFFYQSDGGWEGMRIVLGVDLVMGPVLTFTVFKPGKPGLKFDLTVIGLAQAICLVIGVYVIYTERPLALVYAEGRFFTMTAQDYQEAGVEPPDLSRFPGRGPKRVLVQIPDGVFEEAEFRERLWKAQIPVRAAVDHYVPLSEHMELPIAKGIDYGELRDRDKDGEIKRWLDHAGGKLDDYAFVPFATRFNSVFLGIRIADRTLIGMLDVPAPLG